RGRVGQFASLTEVVVNGLEVPQTPGRGVPSRITAAARAPARVSVSKACHALAQAAAPGPLGCDRIPRPVGPALRHQRVFAHLALAPFSRHTLLAGWQNTSELGSGHR